MDSEVRKQYDRLIAAIATLPEVRSIGKSGGRELPDATESDIDIFVFCEGITHISERKNAISALGECVTTLQLGEASNKHWGVCDFVYFGEVEVCLMHHTISGMNEEISAILEGRRLNKEDNYFYPTGRCASFISMFALFDADGYIASMKKRLEIYPKELSNRLVEYHLTLLNDTEDLERAVSRKDPLFYHFALDLSLDHFLQALFAMNKCFFPSRKRTEHFIQGFVIKPIDCSERLRRVVELGGRAETIHESYDIFQSLYHDLESLR